MTDPVVAYERAADVVASGSDRADEVLAVLASVRAVRADLDRIERELIGIARELETPWVAIAGSLGVASRQAAEQRWLRLRGGQSRDPVRVRSDRRQQRSVDELSGQAIVEIRRAAAELCRRIEADRGWDARHSRATLARTSLAAALEAPPSGLYALCRNAIEDIEQMPSGSLPPRVAAAARRLRAAERAARRG